MQKDSVFKTLSVAIVLCVVCSVLVSTAAVVLKERQEENKRLDIKKNILMAAGVIESSADKADILELYENNIEASVIDLETGKIMEDMDAESFDQVKARKNPQTNKVIDSDKDKAGIKLRSKYSVVYKYKEDGQVSFLILPVNGKGLWSTLYGFLVLTPNTKNIKGIGFYQHGETPGLGGEIDNPVWKSQWAGKSIYDENFNIKLQVIKGRVNSSDPMKDYKVDGLSGATITSNGVTGLVQYWLGEDGFGPYLEQQRASLEKLQQVEEEQEEVVQ